MSMSHKRKKTYNFQIGFFTIFELYKVLEPSGSSPCGARKICSYSFMDSVAIAVTT